LRDFPKQKERVVGRARLLIASCLWIAAFLTSAWGGGYAQEAFSHPYLFFPIKEPNSSPYMNLKDLRLAALQVSSSTVMDETVAALQGVTARYEIGSANYSLEFSGGYVPGMKSLVLSESSLDSRDYLSYGNLTIPLSQFYLKGGAFFGQNVEALGLVFKRPSDEQNPKRGLFGYQIGGGYRFSDSLRIQGGWGQAAQEYGMTREGLGAWYLQAQISLGWGMSVTPQVGFIDITTGDGEKIKEEDFHYGARWQINF
jgi:hypothetical protein